MKTGKFPKTLKVILIVIGAILLLAAGALFFISQDAGNIADQILRDKFNESQLSRAYNLKYKDVEVRPLSGNLIIKELKLTPDSGIYRAHDSIISDFPVLYEVEIPKLVVKGFSPETGLNLDEIAFESISIRNPKVRMIDYLSKEKKAALKEKYAKSKPSATDTTQPTPRHISVGSFELNDGSFEFYDHLKENIVFHSSTIDINVDSLSLRPAHLMEALLQKKYKTAVLELGGLEYEMENGFYDLQLGTFSWKLHEDLFTLSDFELIPQYDTMEFGRKFGRQTDRMDLAVKKIEIHDLNLERLLENGGIETALVRITGPDLRIFRDKNVPLDRTRYPKLPHQAVGSLDRYLKIDKIEVREAHIRYKERARVAEKAGVVPIENLYASIYNVTNDPEVIRKSGPMKWDVQGVFFHEGNLKVEVNFPADLQQESFTFSGSMGAMDMTAFNSITVTNEHIRIEEGHIDSMEFNADADRDYSTGTMVLNYDDLKLAFLKDEAKAGNEELGLLSSLANVVIRSFNPAKNSNNQAEPAEIFFERDKNKSIFNYMAKSMISGIKSTIIPGFNMTEDKYKRQQERQDKKDARQERREERRNNRRNK